MSDGPAPFVAGFGVDDLLLLGRLGLHPAGLVLGYTVHAADRVDADTLPASLETAAAEVGTAPPGEDTVRTAALEAAWSLARARLVAQAEDLGADGVVGVALRILALDGGGRYSVTAHGTAVRSGDLEGRWRVDATGPFTTTLSGRDLWLLARTGYRPLGIALGASTGPHPGPGDLRADGEVPEPAQALYDARDRALARVRAEAQALRADGVVAVHVDGVPPPPGADDLRVVAWGTAVRAIEGTPPVAEPEIVLPLLGGRS